MPRYVTTLPIPNPYHLRTALFGHGWLDLAPHRWDADSNTLHTALEIAGQGVDLRITQHARQIRVRGHSAAPLGRSGAATLRARLRRTLALDIDLRPFWSVCRREPRLHWVERRHAGYMMRSGAVFEDLMKLLFTTNCSWAATRSMVQNLVDALGRTTPSGIKAFPAAASCAAQDEDFYRATVRTGYRAKACVTLARAFGGGDISVPSLDDDYFETDSIDVTERRDRLLALVGFGPYAAGQALRTLGDFEDLALDSWCRARIATLLGKKKPPSDKQIAAMYRPFGKFQGLALWMDLTAEWHGEGAGTEKHLQA